MWYNKYSHLKYEWCKKIYETANLYQGVNAMDSILNNLNEEQKLAVETTEGYVRVIAGAGSGKTRALTHRFAYLVDTLGISTSNILCVTFTNKAANEMKKRVRKLIGDNDLGLICTFHGFCVQVLRDDISKINFPNNFLILDSDDTETILKNVYKTHNIKSTDMTINDAKDYIHGCKTIIPERVEEYHNLFTQTNDEALFKKYMESQILKDKIFYGYLYEQRKNFGLDFDDLIQLTLYIFENNNNVLEKWQNKLEYIMVDEFQDVSGSQFRLCWLISRKHKNLFIVGDPDQTIYTWRGAKVEYFINFEVFINANAGQTYQSVKTIMMTKNYRSASNIIDASNSLIKKNRVRIEKDLIPIKQENAKTSYFHAKTVAEEADWISKQILSLKKMGKNFNDIAILYRAHFVSRSVEESFMRNEIPYVIYSGIGFYNRKEIKDVLCYLRMLTNADDLSFLRTVNEPRRNVGEKRINLLKEYAKKNNCTLYVALKQSLEEKLFVESKAKKYVDLIEKYTKIYKEKNITDLLKELLDESGYEEMLKTQGEEERLNNLAELKQSISDYENSAGEDFGLEDYLSKIALYTSSDKEDTKDCVKMMTIHTAKGLEFPYVFVCSLNEGIFPSKKQDTIDKLEEERRLAYVAFTRAENALFLSESEGYNYDYSFRYPSRFIFNVEKEMLDYCVELEERLIDEATNFIERDENALNNVKINQSYAVGDKVEHKTFGKGEIIQINETDSSLIIKFDNLETNRSIGIKAPLIRIEQK